MKVLLVEDEHALADVIARNLRAHGHDVGLAESAESALLSMAHAWPDALVVDVNLPDHSGWEILRRLAPADRRGLTVVMTSAAPLSARRVSEFQPLRVLQKPFPMDALIRALESTPLSDEEAGLAEEDLSAATA